jgi:uncharacterized Zn finger protein (UPF0148 family)
MEVIMIKCAKCEISYLTIFKSGLTECPDCHHQNTLLVGEDAERAMKKQEEENRKKQERKAM